MGIHSVYLQGLAEVPFGAAVVTFCMVGAAAIYEDATYWNVRIAWDDPLGPAVVLNGVVVVSSQ